MWVSHGFKVVMLKWIPLKSECLTIKKKTVWGLFYTVDDGKWGLMHPYVERMVEESTFSSQVSKGLILFKLLIHFSTAKVYKMFLKKQSFEDFRLFYQSNPKK